MKRKSDFEAVALVSIGIDIGKDEFHVVGLGASSARCGYYSCVTRGCGFRKNLNRIASRVPPGSCAQARRSGLALPRQAFQAQMG